MQGKMNFGFDWSIVIQIMTYTENVSNELFINFELVLD